MNLTDRERLLTVEQCAARLQVHRHTIYRAIKRGRLRALAMPSDSKYGVRYRIAIADLERFANRHLNAVEIETPAIASDVPRGTTEVPRLDDNADATENPSARVDDESLY